MRTLLALLVQAPASGPPDHPAPFFTNDQYGILRVLLFVVGPIVVSIVGFIWLMGNRKLAQDLTGLGEKVDRIDKDQIGVKAELAQHKEDRFEERLAVMDQLTQLRIMVGRIEERTCTGQEMKDAIIEGVRVAAREFRKGE